MLLSRKGSQENFFIEDEGNIHEVSMTASQAMSLISSKFTNHPVKSKEPGCISKELVALPPTQKLRSKIAVPIASMAQRHSKDYDRRAFEVAIASQFRDGPLFGREKLININAQRGVISNNSFKKFERIADETADLYVKKGWVRENDKIADLGSGFGFVAKAFASIGKEVTSIEPDIHTILNFVEEDGNILKEQNSNLSKTIPLTGSEFVESFPDKKFDFVNISNFSPINRRDLSILDGDITKSTKKEVAAAAKMTSKSGRAAFGIASINPEYVLSFRFGIRPILEENYSKVEYFSPKKFFSENEGKTDIAGMMGVFLCSEPK